MLILTPTPREAAQHEYAEEDSNERAVERGVERGGPARRRRVRQEHRARQQHRRAQEQRRVEQQVEPLGGGKQSYWMYL